jgi:hypothetical protein
MDVSADASDNVQVESETGRKIEAQKVGEHHDKLFGNVTP